MSGRLTSQSKSKVAGLVAGYLLCTAPRWIVGFLIGSFAGSGMAYELLLFGLLGIVATLALWRGWKGACHFALALLSVVAVLGSIRLVGMFRAGGFGLANYDLFSEIADYATLLLVLLVFSWNFFRNSRPDSQRVAEERAKGE
jgi:hypothetical protein